MLHTLARTGSVRRGTGASHKPQTCTSAQHVSERNTAHSSTAPLSQGLHPLVTVRMQTPKQVLLLHSVPAWKRSFAGTSVGHTAQLRTGAPADLDGAVIAARCKGRRVQWAEVDRPDALVVSLPLTHGAAACSRL